MVSLILSSSTPELRAGSSARSEDQFSELPGNSGYPSWDSSELGAGNPPSSPGRSERFDVNAEMDEGSFVHFASGSGDVELVQLLLDLGADLRAEDPSGKTALHWAARGGHAAAAALLLDRGADLLGRDRFRSTALHRAAAGGHVSVVALLLDRGIPAGVSQAGLRPPGIQPRHSPHRTALHEAAESGSPDVCALLIDRGADVGDPDSSGETALDKAAEAGHAAVCE